MIPLEASLLAKLYGITEELRREDLNEAPTQDFPTIHTKS